MAEGHALHAPRLCRVAACSGSRRGNWRRQVGRFAAAQPPARAVASRRGALCTGQHRRPEALYV